MQSIPALPTDLQQSLQMASEFRKGGRLAEAERIYRHCMARHPQQPMLLGQLGELLLQNGDGSSALPLLEQARQLAPGHAPFWLLETQCLLALGRPKDAKKVISEGIRKGLRHPLADDLLKRARSGDKPKPGQQTSLKDVVSDLENLLQARRYAQAEKVSAEMAHRHAKSPQLWYLRGMAVLLQGRQQEAIEPLRRAVELDFGMAPALYNLAYALEGSGHLEEALEYYQRSVKAAPQLAEAHNSLGNILQQKKRHEEALSAYDRALALKPWFAPFLKNRGDALRDLDRLEEAVKAYQSAIELQPDLTETYASLAYVLARLKHYAESASVCRRAIERQPNAIDAYLGLANASRGLGQFEQAIVAYRRTLEFRPGDVEIYKNLAATLRDAHRFEEAIETLRQALRINPAFHSAFNLIAGIQLDLGRHEEALQTYRFGLKIDPAGLFAMHSNLLLALNYQAGGSPESLLAEAKAFGAKAKSKANPATRHDNSPDPARRLRVGLVSGDLGNHPVGFFLQNVLESLDSNKVESYAYATSDRKDALNERLRRSIPHWRDAGVKKMDDEALARKIREDRIDILVDLAGHTGKNRLPVFAWKPAPVQVGWLGYLGTTGLEAMDYILADNWALPPGEEDQFTETPWRLPESYICFSPPDLEVAAGRLPALDKGHVTFGCFNNLNKVTDQVIACWARILKSVPGSTLFLKTKSLGAADVREKIVGAFSRHGIDPERLILEGQFASHEDHFRAYHAVDIALDPFPYPGITTTVEALWMGVPVLSLKGDRFISHQGETILNNVGLPQWIAADEDDYVAKATAFAADLPALATLRAGLREQLLASPLCDAPRFARNLEEALRGMWRIWCEKQQAV